MILFLPEEISQIIYSVCPPNTKVLAQKTKIYLADLFIVSMSNASFLDETLFDFYRDGIENKNLMSLKKAGDKSLMVTAVFSEFLIAKGLSQDYYFKIGSASYYQVLIATKDTTYYELAHDLPLVSGTLKFAYQEICRGRNEKKSSYNSGSEQ